MQLILLIIDYIEVRRLGSQVPGLLARTCRSRIPGPVGFFFPLAFAYFAGSEWAATGSFDPAGVNVPPAITDKVCILWYGEMLAEKFLDGTFHYREWENVEGCWRFMYVCPPCTLQGKLRAGPILRYCCCMHGLRWERAVRGE